MSVSARRCSGPAEQVGAVGKFLVYELYEDVNASDKSESPNCGNYNMNSNTDNNTVLNYGNTNRTNTKHSDVLGVKIIIIIIHSVNSKRLILCNHDNDHD